MNPNPRLFHSRFAALLACLAVVGCASTPRNSATLSPRQATLTDRTKTLEVTVQLRGDPAQDVEVPLVVKRGLGSRETQSVYVELSDLPFQMTVREVADNEWRLRLPINVLRLLARDHGHVTYHGRLVIDPVGDAWPQRNVPLELTIQRGGRGRTPRTPRPQRAEPAPSDSMSQRSAG